MKSKYKAGDEVLVLQGYPSSDGSWYRKGDIVTLRENWDAAHYWLTERFPDNSFGIPESYIRKATKLDKALK